MSENTQMGASDGAFPATRWTAVQRARSGVAEERAQGFEALAAVYWRPIYKYVRLRWRRSDADAQDLTQEFFTRMIEKSYLDRFDPEQARLRTYLRTCLDRLVQNTDRDRRRLKRGGAVQLVAMNFVAAEAELARTTPPASDSMVEFFEREWVRSLFGVALAGLRADCERRGRLLDFDLFERYDLVEQLEDRPTYGDLAARLEVTETTVTNRLAAVRRRFRSLVLDRLREMTGSEEEFRREARSVLGVDPK